MSFEIRYTPAFERAIKRLAKKYPSIRTDFTALLAELAVDPHAGTSLGKDCYKIRMAISSKSRGKSGGARVITCVKVVKETIFLLTIYDKSERESITDEELERLMAMVG